MTTDKPIRITEADAEAGIEDLLFVQVRDGLLDVTWVDDTPVFSITEKGKARVESMIGRDD